MNVNKLYADLCQIFKEKSINSKLLKQLESECLPKIGNTLKIYILKFLCDLTDKDLLIENSNDLWFIKDKSENIEICCKYIELMINLLKKDEPSEIKIYYEIEIFFDSEIGNKLIYIISILNKLYLPEQIILLFIGFFLGEKKEFIQKNYLKNLQDLLKIAKSDIIINNKMRITYLKDEILEIINLYIFFLINISEDENSFNSIKNYLIGYEPCDFNINIYYKKLEQHKLLDLLFYDEEDDIPNKSYKEKASHLLQNIKIKLVDFQNVNDSNFFEKYNEESINKNANEEKEEDLFVQTSINNEDNFFLFYNGKANNNIELSSNNNFESTKKQDNNYISTRIEISYQINEIELIKETEKNKEYNNGSISKETFQQNKQEKQLNKNNEINNFFELGDKINNNYMDNNINITESNTEKDSKSNSSSNSSGSRDENNLFDYINKFVDFPKLSELKINYEEQSLNKDFYFIVNSVFLLNQSNSKIDALKHIIKNSILDIDTLAEKIKLETKLRLLSMFNLRLEILINILKNPNIINIKRKLIEIIIFHLYLENKDYFTLPDDYHPTFQNLEELEKLITAKLQKDKNNKKIKKDLKIIKELKFDVESSSFFAFKDKQNKNPIDISKQNELFIAKNFLDFYRYLLNDPVNLLKNSSKFYLLPRGMFNSEIEATKYLFDLESIISDNKSENQNIIIGMDIKKEIINQKIYKNDKLCDIDEALQILFNFNTKFNYLENKAFTLIEEKGNEFLKRVKFIKEFCNDIFMINIKTQDEQSLIFTEDINKQIKEKANYFEKEVLIKLFGLIKDIYEGKIKDPNKEIISNIKKFFINFIEKCSIYPIKQKDFSNINQLLFFAGIKVLILNKMIIFFEESKKYFIEKIKSEEEEYRRLSKIVKKNLISLKDSVQKYYNFEQQINVYENWKKKVNSKYSKEQTSIDKLKKYLSNHIMRKLNLEMSYTYDSKFYLWAIVNEFSDYFFD